MVTLSLEATDFKLLEQLAAKNDIGNATLVRQIIREYLTRETTSQA